jgi:mannose-6-phosphate isomerase-like protein (cupin superfamily)
MSVVPLVRPRFRDLLRRSPEEAETMELLGVRIRFLVTAADTRGAWNLLEYTAPPRFAGPAPHFHGRTGELFYVLEGELALECGDEAEVLGPGGMALVAPRTVHRFSNPADAPCRFLVHLSPAGVEEYFHALGEIVRDAPEWPRPDMRPVATLAERFDTFSPG